MDMFCNTHTNVDIFTLLFDKYYIHVPVIAITNNWGTRSFNCMWLRIIGVNVVVVTN